MQRYMLRRIINLVPVLVLISIVVFSTVRVLPGDPARLLAAIDETGFVDPEVLAAVEKRYGLDKPVVTQYFEWVWGVIRGDWGASLISSQDVFPQIRSRLSFTAQLAGLSWLLSLAIGIPMGVISALKRNSIRDIAVTGFAVSGIALPNFWLGMLMIIFFGVWLGWLPTGGYTSFQDSPDRLGAQDDYAHDNAWHGVVGGHDAADARRAAGGNARGLHTHGAREGLDGEQGRAAARDEKLVAAGHNAIHIAARHAGRRHGGHGDSILPAGYRKVYSGRGNSKRLPRGADGADGSDPGSAGSQSDRRRVVRIFGPAHTIRLTFNFHTFGLEQ